MKTKFTFGIKASILAFFNALKNERVAYVVNSINITNFAIISTILFILGICILGAESSVNIPRPTLSSVFIFYYSVIVPLSILFGIFFSLAISNFGNVLEKYEIFFSGLGSQEEKESWKKEKNWLKYFNPILLPFSIVFIFVRFLWKIIVIICIAIRDMEVEVYE